MRTRAIFIAILLAATGIMIPLRPVCAYSLKAFPNISLPTGLKLLFDGAKTVPRGEELPFLVSEIQFWNTSDKSIWIKAVYTWKYPDGKEVVANYVTHIEPETAWIMCTHAPDEKVVDYRLQILKATDDEVAKEKDRLLKFL